MIIVTDQVSGTSIDGTEEEHHAVCIHGVVTEVEKTTGTSFP